MAFDFQAAVAAANEVVEKASSNGNGGGSGYAYPLVYPQAGSTIQFRPLFNPASGQILRLVNRHEKTACYRTYGQECPICSMMQNVKNVTGTDPFGRTKASRSRGICFAQFVSSSSPIDKGNNKGNLQPGEVVLMMFPWSVYTQINAIIQAAAQTPTGMDQAFSHPNSGLCLQVTVTTDFKYNTILVPFFTYQTQMNEDQWTEFLGKMPSLVEQVLPSTITEEVDKQVKEYTDAIYRQYIAPRTATQNPVPQAPAGFNAPPTPPTTLGPNSGYVNPVPPTTSPYTNQPTSGTTYQSYPPQSGFTPSTGYPPQSQTPQYNNIPAPQIPFTGTPAPTTPQTSGRPSCYGNHQDNDPKCIMCPCEVECMSAGK